MALSLDIEEAHPLFLPENDDDEVKEVEEIQVFRYDQGKRFCAPRLFKQQDLQSLEQLFAEYGGGDYELVARAKHRITSRRKITLQGKPKPLFDTGIDPEEVVKPVTGTSTIPVTTLDPMQAIMSGQGGVMGLIMMMFQSMMAQQAQAAQLAAQQGQQQTQMMIAMMQNGSEKSAENLKVMMEQQRIQAEVNSRKEEQQMTLMRELMAASRAPEIAGADGAFMKGMEFAQSQFKNQIETIKATAKNGGDIDWEGLLETGMQVLGGIQQFKGAFGGEAGGVPGAIGEASAGAVAAS